MRIALFVTCLADALFPEVGRPPSRCWSGSGHEVVFPPAQTCCGQMHVNTGYQREALPLVRHHVEVFERATTCDRRAVGVVRRLGAPPARDGRPAGRATTALAGGAEAVAARTYELSELLVDVLGVEDVGAYYPHRVTYHPTCHSLRMLRVGDKPLRLLRARPRASTWSSCPTPTSAAASAARSRSRTPTPRRRCSPTRCANVLVTGAEVCTAGDAPA